MGQALYELKYRQDRKRVRPIAQAVVEFVQSKTELADVCAVIAVPPSDIGRTFQPVPALAAAIGAGLALDVPKDYLVKTKKTSPVKDVSDVSDRQEELRGAFQVVDERFRDRHVLLFDDLFRSGGTLTSVSTALYEQGKVGKVSVVTATMTRSKR